MLRVRKERYELNITCQARNLAPEPPPVSRLVETKFLRLRKPAALGDQIDGWRVCWVGGLDRGKVLFVVMVSRSVYLSQQK